MNLEAERMLGESPAFLRVLEEVSLIAPLRKPVLIVGERGTGKELIAARMHFLSERWEGVFLKMNCAAISDSLLESELFGHEPGAFTGATKLHQGRFERANGGTLFLDELATTSSLVQEKILRIIEYGEFERLGGQRTLSVDVRLVAATNEDLPSLAAAGKFRADLLDRLAFDVITLPPLRERGSDILLLAEQFAINMATSLGWELFPGFTERATDTLLRYPWPGNIRELKNAVERAVYRGSPAERVDQIVLDPFQSPFRPAARALPVPGMGTDAMPPRERETPPPQAESLTPPTPQFPVDLREMVKNLEVDTIKAALDKARHNQRKAADLLSLSYHQFRGYLKKYRLTGSDAMESTYDDDPDDAG
jgi:psp operon transcriptional activator